MTLTEIGINISVYLRTNIKPHICSFIVYHLRGGNMKKIFIKGTALTVSGMLLLGGCSAGHGGEAIQESRVEQESFRQNASEQESEQDSMERDSSVQQESSEEADSDMKTDEMTDGGVPTIKITQDRKEWYTDDGEVLLLEAVASKVEVLSEGYDALKEALAGQWKGLDGYDNEELEWAKDHYASMSKEDDSYFPSYSVIENAAIYRIDNHVVSLCENFYEYAGGAHGMYGISGSTFDVESGKKLQLNDILTDSQGFYDKALEYIIAQIKENYGEALFQDYEETIRTDTFGETPASWYLDNTGIVIDYDLYQITPYAAGIPSVTLPYDEFAEYIKEDYRMSGESFITNVNVNEDFSGLIRETGEVMLTVEYPDAYSDAEVTVVSGNARETVGTFGRVASSYVIKRADGRSFLIFDCDYASDDYVTYVYEITGGAVQACEKLDGAAWSGACIGTDRIGLSMHLDVLGTYGGEMTYQLTDDGKLVQTDEIFAVNASSSLTVIKELPVTINGEAATIPAGTKIRITGTDNDGKAYFKVDADNGETGMIEYVRDTEMWQILIDGVSEFEYFEMIPYVG